MQQSATSTPVPSAKIDLNDPLLANFTEADIAFSRFMIHQLEGLVDENHPYDKGGRTRYGVTKKELDKQGFDIDDFGYIDAINWYCVEYIYQPNFHQILDDEIRMRMFVDGVHIGVFGAATNLQEILNAMNLNGQRWDDIEEDGLIGDQTLSCLYSYRHNNSIRDYACDKLFEMLRAQTFVHYLRIVRSNPEQEVFFNGWVQRLNKSKLPTVQEITNPEGK